MRTCNACFTRKPLEEFRWVPSRNRYHAKCRSCERVARRLRRERLNAAGTTATPRAARGRAFGVEIELTGPSAETIEQALIGIGITPRLRGYAATTGSNWELKTDGSVSGYGLELVSPKLYGDAGLETLDKVLTALRSVDATVDRSCGIHVHIDFRNKTIDEIKNAITPILRAQDVFYQMVAPSRRSNGYSPAWSATDMEALAGINRLDGLSYCGPRGFVNVGAYPRHGSIEFRSHGGSTNSTKILAWVRLLLAAVKYGEDNGADTVLGNSIRTVCRNLGLSDTDTRALRRFELAAERAAEQEETDDYANMGFIDASPDAELNPVLPRCGVLECDSCGYIEYSAMDSYVRDCYSGYTMDALVQSSNNRNLAALARV